MEKHTSIFDSLKEQTLSYSADDYRTDAPYQWIRSLAHDNVIRYIQYLNVLLADAEKKCVPYDAAKAQSDKVQLKMDCPWAHNFLSRVAYEGQKPDANKKVRVLPLMCGSGKSAAISQIMAERIEEHLFYQNPENQEKLNDPVIARMAQEYGILVVTDDIERMRGYMAPSKQAYAAKALIDHPELVTIMTRDNLADAMATCAHTPVLVMTTQRYFRLSMEEIERFLCWNHGRRNFILFDEQPMMLQYIQVSNTTLDQVSSALADQIQAADQPDEKAWCLQQWRMIARRISETLYQLEHIHWSTDRNHPNAHCYFAFSQDERLFTENDMRFMRFIEQHKSLLNNHYWTILAVRQLMMEGAVYCCTRLKSRYESLFGIVLDHRSKITETSASVIVFDGTGDLIPDYCDERFVIDWELGTAFRRDLSNVTISFVDQNTSKVHLLEDDQHRILKGTVSYLTNLWKEEKGAVFIYEQQERHLRKIIDEADLSGKILLQHFGAVRGSNAYRLLKNLAQIGLFSRTPFQHLCLSLHLDQEGLNHFQQLELDDGNRWLNTYMDTSNIFRQHHLAYLVADTEQNIFRGAVRNPDYNDEYSYTIFCREEAANEVAEQLQKRYPEAAIVRLDTPLEIRLAKIRQRNGETPSYAQRILQYLDQLPFGAEFTVKEMLQEVNISAAQLKECRRNTPEIQILLKRLKIGKSQRHQKTEGF